MTAEEKLADAFRQGLGLPNDHPVSDLVFMQHPNWDSIAHMQLINRIEQSFGIMIEFDDVIGMSSYQVAREILSKYGVEF